MGPEKQFNQYDLRVHGYIDAGHISYNLGSDRNPDNSKDIVYRFNNDRMRNSVNIDDLNLDNYLLAAGCSFTEGVGLNLESLYWYKLARKLGLDSYSLGIGGCGNDTIFYQVNTWLSRFPPPKVLLIQLSNYDRAYSLASGKTLMPGELLQGGTISMPFEKYYFTSRLDAKVNVWDMMQHISIIKNLRRLLPNTKIFTIGINLHPEINKQVYPVEFEFDYWLDNMGFAPARDGHHGPEAHRLLAYNIYVNMVKTTQT